MAWAQASGNDLILLFHCQPGAKVTRIVGIHDDRLKLQLQAPALENRANEALIAWLSLQLGVPRRQIELVSGQASRKKRVLIKGCPLAAAQQLLNHIHE